MNPLFWYTNSVNEIWKFIEGRQAYIRVLGENTYTPIKPAGKEDIIKMASKHKGLVGFYASSSRRVGKEAIITPVWVVELLDHEVWRLGLDAAWLIARYLEENGVKESIYLVYYDRFFEVRIHEEALIGDGVIGDASRVVELVLRELKVKLQRLVYASGAKIKIYNGLGERLLIAPRSLYSNDRASVYFKPEDIEYFDPSWSFINEYRGSSTWDKRVRGEALELARKAVEKIRDDKRTIIELRRVVGPRKIDRFQVMGLLQAARYYLLTGDLEKAKSFGYNRAVFYAWAKHYGRGFRAYRRIEEKTRLSIIESSEEKTWKQKEVFGEPVTISPRGWYGMGGEEHIPKHFDEHIARKIELQVPFEVAWKAAVEYVKKFPRKILEDQQLFFKQVYQPVRDSFIEDVLLKRTPPQQALYTSKTKETTIQRKEESTRKPKAKPPITTLDQFIKHDRKNGEKESARG